MAKNILTMPPAQAREELARKRQARMDGIALKEAADRDRKHKERMLDEKSKRAMRVMRALLATGEKDGYFTGFNGDESYWLDRIEANPDEWVWVKAKAGVLGIPFPDGKEYSFPPKTKFPLYKEYMEHVHESMNGEIRRI